MTWKDSLNLPVSAQGEWAAKRFYGDPKLAAAYLPVAYALLGEVKNRMAYGGVSFGHRMIELPDGTRIRVIRNGEQNILEIETVPTFSSRSVGVPGVYMESGFIDARNIKAAFLPKMHLYETQETSNTADYKDTLDLADLPKSILDHNRSHAIPGGLDDKRYMKYLPLTVTGLLRRTVQSLLGRADPSYEMPGPLTPKAGEQSAVNQLTRTRAREFIFGPGNIGNSGNLFLLLASATQTIGMSRGLLRTEDYRYFYIRIAAPNVYGYPCTINEVGLELIEFLRAGEYPSGKVLTSDDREKLEAYVLSGLSIDSSQRFVIGEIEVAWGSVFNGWHFNSDGSKADIISVHRVVNEAGKDLYLKNRHYRLSFTVATGYDPDEPISDENAPLSLALHVLEETTSTPRNNIDNLWIPYYFEWKMIVYYWSRRIGGFIEKMEYYDAPVYCFYDRDDKLVVLRVSYEEKEVPPPVNALNFWRSVYSCSGEEVEKEEFQYNSLFNGGFYFAGGSDYRQDTKSGRMLRALARGESTGQTVVLDREGTSTWSPTIHKDLYSPCGSDDPSGYGGIPLFTQTLEGGYGYGERYGSSVYSENAEFIAIIPFFDTEAIYCGKAQTRYETGTQFYFWRTGIVKETVEFKESGDTLVFISAYPSDASLSAGGGLPTKPLGRDWRNIGQQEFTAFLDLHYKNGQIEAVRFSYKEDVYNIGKIIAEMGKWSALIDPVMFGPRAYPFFDQPYVVNQGILDNLIYYTDPKSPTYPEGFKQRNIVGLGDDELKELLFSGIFSGWT